MAARASRSASRKARATEAVATGPLGALSHDELGVIFEGLADPLQPVVAVALSSTCLGLRTPLQAAIEVLKERHERTVALCRKVGSPGCAALRDAEVLLWIKQGLTADDMATLAMILRTNGLPRLLQLYLGRNRFGDAGMQALCEGLGPGAAPSLSTLDLSSNQFGPAGAEALAAALRKGALPKLEALGVGGNPFGNQGMAALAEPLRKLHALNALDLGNCELGNEGVASLVAKLGKDDFKLGVLFINDNKISDAGGATFVSAIDGAGLSDQLFWPGNPCSEATHQAVVDALARAKARRASS